MREGWGRKGSEQREGKGKGNGRVRGRESSDISTHHSPVSVSGMVHSSFHDLLQTDPVGQDKHMSAHSQQEERREGERGGRRGEGKGEKEGGGGEEGGGGRERKEREEEGKGRRGGRGMREGEGERGRRGSSGVARLGHTGAHALATRGCAPPVQACIPIIGADSKLLLIANRALNGLQIEWRSIAMFIHRITSLVPSLYVRVCRILK